MKFTLLLLVLFSFSSYAQNAKADTNSITVTKNYYVLNIKGVKSAFKTTAELSNELQRAKPSITKDTLYVYMANSSGEKTTQLSAMFRKLKIKKYQYIVTDDFFALPYSKDTDKAKQR